MDTPLALVRWSLFVLSGWRIMPAVARMSTNSEAVIREVAVYGRIVCVFSFGLFLESIWTKVLQASDGMEMPMFAQIAGVVANFILDPLFIFGTFGSSEMGIAGAVIATVTGQIVAMLVAMQKGFCSSLPRKKYPAYVVKIFKLGVPNMLMQSAYTFYIVC